MGADRQHGVCNPVRAGQRLIKTFHSLAERREHLLTNLLAGQAPVQWQHYPENDAVDEASGYQWFYHSHATEDRAGTAEHGHLHIFARRKLWSRRMRSNQERAFAEMVGAQARQVNTRHLLGVGINAKGIPISLFTVNSWVTGDLMLSAQSTAKLLGALRLNTGHAHIDAVIEDVMALCTDEILEVLYLRDQILATKRGTLVLEDRRLDIISEIPVDLDEKITALMEQGRV